MPRTRKTPTQPIPRQSGDPNEHGDEGSGGPVRPGEPQIQAIPDIALQVRPRPDPSPALAASLPQGPIRAALESLDIEVIKAALRAAFGAAEVRYQGKGPDGSPPPPVKPGGKPGQPEFNPWFLESLGSFGAWMIPRSGTADAVARDNWLRNLSLLESSDAGGLMAAISVPIGYIERQANLALAEIGDIENITDHASARLLRVEVRPGPNTSSIDTTVHGQLLRDGIRRNYKFFLTVRDTLSIESVPHGSYTVGVVKVSSRVTDAGIDGAGGVVARIFNQAIALTRGGFIVNAIVKWLMRIVGLYPGIGAAQGEDYLNLAIELGLVDGDQFAGVGAIAAALAPRQQLLAPAPLAPGQKPPKNPPPRQKMLFNLNDIEVTSTAVRVKGTLPIVARETGAGLAGGTFSYHVADRTLRGTARIVTVDIPGPLTNISWTVVNGTATPANQLSAAIAAPVQASFMPITARVSFRDSEGITHDASGSFVATSTVQPPTGDPDEPVTE